MLHQACLPMCLACCWPQVRLRRSIGMKKDDYYLDKKHIT